MTIQPFGIELATAGDAPTVAALVAALTDEIIARTGIAHFAVDVAAYTALCRRYLEEGRYAVLLARTGGGEAIGCATLCQSHALYAGGDFGIVQEFYVQPAQRSLGVGRQLLRHAARHAEQRGWSRLELCTPPLPAFDDTLRFYQRHGFEITGGRKLKWLPPAGA